MKLISVRCDHCGGPIDITEGTEVVRCTHCAATLSVVRRANGFVTEERLQEIEKKLQRLDLRSRLAPPAPAGATRAVWTGAGSEARPLLIIGVLGFLVGGVILGLVTGWLLSPLIGVLVAMLIYFRARFPRRGRGEPGDSSRAGREGQGSSKGSAGLDAPS